jgi:DNA-binding NarL/FixJ family response regulator
MGEQLDVYLVADFEPLRRGLANMIEEQPDMKVMAMAGSLEEMASTDQYRVADVIVADVESLNQADMPRLYQRIGEWIPGMKMLFLGSEADANAILPENVPVYMSLKTVGFVLKTGSTSRLSDAVRLVAAGAFVCEIDVIRRILTRLTQWANATPSSRIDELSDRETEVLALVANGRSNREIAQELFLSEGTVKIHVSHIMTKLDIDRRIDLARFAIARGLVSVGKSEDWITRDIPAEITETRQRADSNLPAVR